MIFGNMGYLVKLLLFAELDNYLIFIRFGKIIFKYLSDKNGNCFKIYHGISCELSEIKLSLKMSELK